MRRPALVVELDELRKTGKEGRLMADTRVFRVVRSGGKIEYAHRAGLRARISGQRHSYKGRLIQVFATNAEATDGWADVTEEFLKQ